MEEIAKLVRGAQRFLLTTHAMPDGDGLGSQMAFHNYLKKTGKKSYVINPHATPAKFALVDPRGEIQVFDPSKPLPDVDLVIIFDTNETKMLGAIEPALKKSGTRFIFVDHHVPEEVDPTGHLIDEQYAATGELVYSFLRHMRADVDAEIALGLYVAIVTDTGSFRFKRTTPRSHLIAAELLQKGVQPENVFQQIYAHDSFGKIRLFGWVLEGLKTTADERIAWITVPAEMRDRYEATIEDTENYVNQLTYIEGVDIAMLFREEPDGVIKVSLRGRGEIPVIGIAKKFGGGGHRHAAGMRVKSTLDKVVKEVCEQAMAVIAEFPRDVKAPKSGS